MTSPFPAVDEVPLDNPPIVRALVQVHIAPVWSIADEAFVAPFQEAIRQRYPSASATQAVQVLLSHQGVEQQVGERMWRFAAADGWAVTLASSFVTVETTQYTSRTDMVERTQHVLEAVVGLLGPETVTHRLGVRYVNRIDGPDFDRLGDFVAPAAQGAAGFAVSLDAPLVHSFCEAAFDTGEGSGLTVRWGVLPPDVSVAPDVAPTATRSWVLDSDSYALGSGGPIDVVELSQQIRLHCDATYRVFRWAVTDTFLSSRGAFQ
jgi:uncharacterized protein (TIGR04255 family)